jgi:hypothetical protein
MHEDFAQRRRVAVALAITVILVPAAFLLDRGGDGAAEEPGSTLVGPAVTTGDTTTPGTDTSNDAGPNDGSNGPAATDPMGTTPIEYIQGTVPPQADDPATIAVPRVGRAIRGDASFSRGITNPASCQVRDLETIPFESTITVTNLDNSRSIRCIARVGGTPPSEAVILSADAFLRIGDLTDAPLSVEISW